MTGPADSPETRLAELGIPLPDPLPAFGEYAPAVRTGDQLWVGGHFGTQADGSIVAGRVGDTLDVEAAAAAARSAAFNALATIRAELGTLDAVDRIVHLHGAVHCTPEFTGQTAVIDAASRVFVEVFGDRGRHARLAVGVAALPAGLALEIELVLTVRPGTSAAPDGGGR